MYQYLSKAMSTGVLKNCLYQTVFTKFLPNWYINSIIILWTIAFLQCRPRWIWGWWSCLFPDNYYCTKKSSLPSVISLVCNKYKGGSAHMASPHCTVAFCVSDWTDVTSTVCLLLISIPLVEELTRYTFSHPQNHQTKVLEILTLIQIPSFSVQLGVAILPAYKKNIPKMFVQPNGNRPYSSS